MIRKLFCTATICAGLVGGSAGAQQSKADLSFSRAYGVGGIIDGSLEESTALAGVPPVAMAEVLQAFASAIDLNRDVHDGDRFYVRYEEDFSIDGRTTAHGRVLWAELRLKGRKDPIAIHRFRALASVEESFWLASGQSSLPAMLRLPLDTYVLSSGFGLRVDPMDQLPRRVGGRLLGKGPARAPALPPGLTSGRDGSGLLHPVDQPTPLGLALGLPQVSMGISGPLRSVPNVGAMEVHQGIDLVAPPGTAVRAAGDGWVLGAEPKGPYGNWIEIEHDGSELATVYGHLSSFAPGIGPGAEVKRGDIVGFVGSTGRSTGPHVHFELHVKGHPVNPMVNPAMKHAQLRGLDLIRFRKVVARDLAEREHDAQAM
jgi:Peptidase family M23